MEALVLLSGGRDSLLSACLKLDCGMEIIPAVCYNGHMEGVDRVQLCVDSLKKRYGSNVRDLVQFYTGMTMQSYLLDFWTNDTDHRFDNFPLYQVHCLACKSAMYAHAISYCKAKEIRYLIDGMRKNQGFFVDTEIMKNHFSDLCYEQGVHLLTPVYELESDLDRKRMLSEHGLPTKTLEPQCFLGCPLRKELTDEECAELDFFYVKFLRDAIKQSIQDLCVPMRWVD